MFKGLRFIRETKNVLSGGFFTGISELVSHFVLYLEIVELAIVKLFFFVFASVEVAQNEAICNGFIPPLKISLYYHVLRRHWLKNLTPHSQPIRENPNLQ